MKIQHTNGLYWNEENKCFGPEESATVYARELDLPVWCDDLLCEKYDARDIRYYRDDLDEAEARVVL